MIDVTAREVQEFTELKDPGQYMFTGAHGRDDLGTTGLLMCCPCGCGVASGVQFQNSPGPGPKWTWNGSREKPSITPSIRKLNGCLWHGFLTDGVFRSC